MIWDKDVLIENSKSRQLIGGELKPVENNCIFVALKTYKEKFRIDRNPLIVQMILGNDKIIPHWYYRSDYRIEQHFLLPAEGIAPFIGELKKANPFYYGKFKTCLEAMNFLPKYIDEIINFYIDSGNDKIVF